MGLSPDRESEMAIAEGDQDRMRARPGKTSDSREYGYVEATVEGQLVTYRPDGGFEGFSYGHPMPDGVGHKEIMEAVILEIGRRTGKVEGAVL